MDLEVESSIRGNVVWQKLPESVKQVGVLHVSIKRHIYRIFNCWNQALKLKSLNELIKGNVEQSKVTIQTNGNIWKLMNQ